MASTDNDNLSYNLTDFRYETRPVDNNHLGYFEVVFVSTVEYDDGRPNDSFDVWVATVVNEDNASDIARLMNTSLKEKQK